MYEFVRLVRIVYIRECVQITKQQTERGDVRVCVCLYESAHE